MPERPTIRITCAVPSLPPLADARARTANAVVQYNARKGVRIGRIESRLARFRR
jgi:hypothetical protein